VFFAVSGGEFEVNSYSKTQSSEGCSQVLDEDPVDSLTDYEEAEVTAQGKYRCRDCGMLFDTLEEHDRHHREIHSQEESYPSAGLPIQASLLFESESAFN
jgi:hypothetical protein